MRQTKKLFIYLTGLVISAATLLTALPAAAAPLITFRSVQISSALPGANISETFGFNLRSTSLVGSISFEHCSNSPQRLDPCTAPAGYDATAGNLTAQTNNTGFSIDTVNSTANRIIITRVPANGVLGNTTYGFTNITNTTTSGQTVYVRIATYASTDATGPVTDEGAMAYAVQGGFSVGAYVPPFLIFCAAITVGSQCGTVSGALISFGELSTAVPRTATSQFSGATNDFSGYSVFIDGHTMTAGNLVIPAMSGSGSVPGTSQFGFNLRANTVPAVGANQTGAGSSAIAANYNVPNSYRMSTGDLLTSSPISTDFNVTTVSYVVNIAPSQQPGYYATTLTFIATASF
jgi:hypothetical protein